MEKIDELLAEYKNKKDEIRQRLEEFESVLDQPDNRIFAELAFCLCTPQSRATLCWKAVQAMEKNNVLLAGNRGEIRPFLNSVRFGDSKSGYIEDARKLFGENGLKIKNIIMSFPNSFQLREWLVENVKGLGLKEASHFIRNIGFDHKNQLAILDRHILKNLKVFGIIEDMPKTLTRKKYIEIEHLMKKFANELKMSLYELDMMLWSRETGIVFK